MTDYTDHNPTDTGLTATTACVAIVDDDDDLRESLIWLLDSVGLRTRAYASGDAFLDADPQQHDAILLDVRMPGLSGLQVQQRLQGLDTCPPLIMISGHGDVSMAVAALKAGAVDFIEKPFNQQQLIDIIQQALVIQRERLNRQQRLSGLQQRYADLRLKEQQVLKEVARGYTSREIAQHLELSAKTVEVYRQRIMKALGAGSLAHLIRLSVALELVDTLPDQQTPES
ncbi:response regulator transcription factor [Halomonas huangheensis]|uniref:response regulator transcription factor n=1 Tax=Halomonas huangheensis TaxID=1178482 RepID=UPI0004172E5A|nr:response regulator [Halomonas huangheensis]